MTTKKTTKTRTTKRAETSGPSQTMQSAYEAHTIAQLVFRHLVATGRVPAGPYVGAAADPRFGFEPPQWSAEAGPWSSPTAWRGGIPMTPTRAPGHWPL